jgi:hypothetical protein
MNEINANPVIKKKYVLLFILFTYLISSILTFTTIVPSVEDQYGFALKLLPTIYALFTGALYYFLGLFSKSLAWQILVLCLIIVLCFYNIYYGYLIHYDI